MSQRSAEMGLIIASDNTDSKLTIETDYCLCPFDKFQLIHFAHGLYVSSAEFVLVRSDYTMD